MPREAPDTSEGWYALHDFRTVNWDEWRDAPERARDAALDEGIEHLAASEGVEEGSSAVFSVLGHKADLLVVHFRPTMAELDTAERAFEGTAFADVTERANSYVSVTEVGGYTSDQMTKDPEDIEDAGIANYVQSKLYPSIPNAEFVSFYPMEKRRLPEYNWYDLPIEERAEMMASHGEIGKGYAGKVVQIITGSIAMDDWEWGVTLFGDDVTDLKELLYEMRFDEGSSKYAEFGQFYVGRRFPPADLPAFMAGEEIPVPEDAGHHHGGSHGHGDAHAGDGHDHGSGDADGDENRDIRGELEDLNIYAGKPHGEDVYATVLYSEADPDELFEEVAGLRGNFGHYGSHVKTAVYESGARRHGNRKISESPETRRVSEDAPEESSGEGNEPRDAKERGRSAVVSIWETASAADTAAGFLSELPDIVSRAGEASGFGTMGMFYTVKPEHREDFVEKFETVGGVLEGMEGHDETDLMVNREDENDMFIASQWRSRDDAMAFFRSDDFSDTVDWGRDVLADRPRHVFLA